MLPNPKELDAQSRINIDSWVDVDSELCKEIDDNYPLTKKMLKLGFKEPAFLATDSLGRVWGKGEDQYWYPFHFEYNGKLIGYRLSKKAAN